MGIFSIKEQTAKAVEKAREEWEAERRELTGEEIAQAIKDNEVVLPAGEQLILMRVKPDGMIDCAGNVNRNVAVSFAYLLLDAVVKQPPEQPAESMQENAVEDVV